MHSTLRNGAQLQEIMGIDPVDQLALVNFEEVSNDWVITLLNKVVLDKDGIILDGFVIFGNDFPIYSMGLSLMPQTYCEAVRRANSTNSTDSTTTLNTVSQKKMTMTSFVDY